MAEIYRDSSNYAYLDVDGGVTDAPPTATCIDAAGNVTTLDVSGGTVTSGIQRWSTVINAARTKEVGELTVDWNFTIDGDELIKNDYFNIIVPLVDLGSIRDELELSQTQVSDDTLVRAERRVRRIIENTTGQVFAPETTTYIISTTSSRMLRLPRRLISIDSLNINGYLLTPSDVVLDSNRWQIRKFKQYYPGDYIKSGAVIADPYSQLSAYWRGGGYLEVTGRWGWERVPEPVFEATLILLEEILCPESGYRDRYVKTMTAADFRFEFDPGAYVGTGNVIADHILRDFRVPNMAAVL